MSKYPTIKDPDQIGSYPAVAKSGGGYVWDEVLEYRVWCHPEHGSPDTEDALVFANENREPIQHRCSIGQHRCPG